MSYTPIDPALSFGLNFDSRDLYANQQGYISTRQVRLLRDKRRQQTQPPSLLSRLAGSLFFVIYGITPQQHQWNLIGADITATLAHHQQGQVALPRIRSYKDNPSVQTLYQIAVNRKLYRVDRRALRSFRHQAEYTLYYAPHSRLALSAESN